MKKIRLLIIVCIVVTLGFSWGVYIRRNTSAYNSYKNNIKQADQWTQEGLYDRAIGLYEQVVQYEASQENWDKLLKAHQLKCNEAQEDEDQPKYDYSEALEAALVSIKNNAEWAITLANIYVEREDYKSAYTCLNNVKSNGAESKELDELLIQIEYEYEIESASYQKYKPLANGTYAVSNGVAWSIIDEKGQIVNEMTDYEYISPTGMDGVYLITKEKGSRLYDSEGKVLGIFKNKVSESGQFAENRIAVSNGNTYFYYDSFAKEKFGGYERAGTFKDCKAAVMRDGKWGVIDNEGKNVIDFKFDDIKLDGNGYYDSNGVVIASENGKYSIYDTKFKQINKKFVCDDLDIAMQDGIIAYKEGGKWGFVNLNGEVVIKPEYDEAKSFSNGVAAVKKDEKWGFINSDNRLVIDCQFEEADYMNLSGRCFIAQIDPNTESKISWQQLKLKLADN